MTRRHLIFLRCDEVTPRLPSLGRGVASFFCWKARRHLIFQCWDEVLPRSYAGRRGDASSSFVGTWHCLVLLLEGEAVPRSSSSASMRCCLVLTLEDEAAPHSPVGRRGGTSFSRRKTRRRLVFLC
ncbi:hypothetical protein B296_00036860 [Ensete ventricosum]|uniref:Uncharacterized protein n=1 Tax=Ensete ventricosum TaxID=4639 RepID=A0A426YU82_ENSVE|nr:hypothetical protein B296_00036860 [Ensete ventricosum]